MRFEYNQPLRSEDAVHHAVSWAKSQGWPIHPDFPKNWDAVLAAKAVIEHAPVFHAGILDAGADRVSTFLPILEKIGYADLDGCNILEPGFSRVGNIRYLCQNIEETNYGSERFDFIACLSTIEHGVDINKFLAEVSRILKPGGHLFVSTDFWVDHIDTGTPKWRIFTPKSIGSLLGKANYYGLSTTSDVSFDVQDRLPPHEGLSYTFMNLLFRKDPR